MTLSLEEVDLRIVASALAGIFAGSPPLGYLEGRTALRDAVVMHLRCSLTEAEELVDTMEAQGFLRFEGDPAITETGLEAWRIEPG